MKIFEEEMLVSNLTPHYVYWNDLNELCERLSLLFASQQSGNTNHSDELTQ